MIKLYIYLLLHNWSAIEDLPPPPLFQQKTNLFRFFWLGIMANELQISIKLCKNSVSDEINIISLYAQILLKSE